LLTVKISISIALVTSKEVICFVVEEIAKVEENIFPKFLLGATMQDSGIREKRNDILVLKLYRYFVFYNRLISITKLCGYLALST